MRYFTPEWWASAGDHLDDEPIEAYRKWFDEARARLPAQVGVFFDRHTLHDARIAGWDADYGSDTLNLLLHGWDVSFNRRFAYDLRYSGANAFKLVPHLRSEMVSVEHLGDLGYDEFDVLRAGVFEHRMLFASGQEMVVRFADFAFDIGALTP
jgi:hypothetical protein